MTTPKINSLSCSLVDGVTLYRNQPGVANKIAAQGGYVLTALVATIEIVAALVFSVLSLALYPFSSKPLEHSVEWLGSSALSLESSVIHFLLNPFRRELEAERRTSDVAMFCCLSWAVITGRYSGTNML